MKLDASAALTHLGLANPQNPEIFFVIAQTHMAAGNTDEAREAFERAGRQG